MVTVHHSNTQQESELRLVDFSDLRFKRLTLVEERQRIWVMAVKQKLPLNTNKTLSGISNHQKHKLPKTKYFLVLVLCEYSKFRIELNS